MVRPTPSWFATRAKYRFLEAGISLYLFVLSHDLVRKVCDFPISCFRAAQAGLSACRRQRRFRAIRHLLGLIAALAVGLAGLAGSASGAAFETKAAQAFMIEAETGTVLYAKDPDKPVPPASLAKLMTMEVVFHEIEQGRRSLDETFTVSQNAWKTGGAGSGGSTMFAKPNSSIALVDLIQAVIIQSANDGCIAIAEGIAGSEEAFAGLMNERARELGLTHSVFKNSTGLPAEGQVVTMRELAELGIHIWRTYPEFYKYYSQRDFTWNKIKQRNRNPLLSMNIGADGMKTGFTEDSGYAIVGAITREGRRLFVAMSGMTSERERAQEARKLLDYGVDGFERLPMYAQDEIIGQAKVYGGQSASVALRAAGPVTIFVPKEDKDRLTARIVYQGPVAAPIEAGARIGALRVFDGETLSQDVPLFAAEAVDRGPLHRRAYDAVAELLTGWLR